MDNPRNIQFTKLIKIDGRQREFNFRKRTPERYDVDTGDERGERVMFKLVKKENTWVLQAENIAGWLTKHEKNIAQVLIEFELE